MDAENHSKNRAMGAKTISKKQASSKNRVKYSLIGFFFCGLLFASLKMQAQTYAPADVAVINALIANNGLKATSGDPANWSFAIWSRTTPHQITELKLNHSNMDGAVSFSGLTQLNGLFCDNNNLTALDVTNCPQLVRLWCYDNNLTKLDVTQNTQLAYLLCHHNNLTELDVTKNTQLQILRCDKNVLIANINANLIVTKNTNAKNANTISDRQGNDVTVDNPITKNASDIIMLKDGQEIKAKVTEITLTEIKYKLFEHLDGPTRTAAKSDVFVIIYENGTREVISSTTNKDRNTIPLKNAGKDGYFGIRTGVNLTTVGGDKAKYKFGFQLGIIAEFPIKNENIFIQPSILFSQMGYKWKFTYDETVDGTDYRFEDVTKYVLNYFQIPVNFQYRHNFGGSVLLLNTGIYLGYGTGGKEKEKDTMYENGKKVDSKSATGEIKMGSDSKNDYKAFDFGIGIGAGLQFNNKIQVGAGYNLGLVSISHNGDIKNHALSITLTYIFGK
jgi:hypothetical protein